MLHIYFNMCCSEIKKKTTVDQAHQYKSLKSNFKNIFDELKYGDDEQFFKFVRMDKNTFAQLLEMVVEKIRKKQSRKTILPEHRLAITLQLVKNRYSAINM